MGIKRVTWILALLCMVIFVFVGCDEKIKYDEPETLSIAIDKVVKSTESAIAEEDIVMARKLWSQVSEYGIKAKEAGEDELAISLEKLACTFEYLVDYLDAGDQEKLEHFQLSFSNEISDLRKTLER